MQSATKGIFFILAFILLIFGVIDVAEQLKAGEDIYWRVPIIFIGLGVGIPFALFSFPGMFSNEYGGNITEEAYDEGGGDGD